MKIIIAPVKEWTDESFVAVYLFNELLLGWTENIFVLRS